MSIKQRENDIIHSLRESRKAILGRGGEISETAGIKDIPEAIWSIPAGNSLAFKEDSSIAYEKGIPNSALEYIRIKKIGCMSYMPHKNLLSYPYVDTTKFYNGVQYTDNGDGTITTSGSVPAYTESYFILTQNLYLQDGKTYYFSNGIALRYTDATGNIHIEQYNHKITWKSSYTLIDLCIYFKSGNYSTLVNKTVTPICTETPLGDNPLTKPLNVGISSISSLGNPTSIILETKELPKELQSLKGWGLGIDAEHNNHIEWRNGRVFYVQMLDEVDLGDFKWRYFTSKKYFVTYPSVSTNDSSHIAAWERMDLPNCSSDLLGVGLSANYTMQPANTVVNNTFQDKTIGLTNPSSMYGCVISVRNNAYTSADDIRSVLKGEKFIYLLKTPIETDITHLFPNPSPFIKTPETRLVFNNDEKLPIPSTIKYTIKVG